MNSGGANSPFWWMAGASLLTSAAAISFSAIILAFSMEWRQRLLPHLLSFSIGTLLGAAFQGLIPHALERVPASRLFPVFLAGVVGFMILERLMLWRHCHEGDCEAHATFAVLVLVGDAMHNFVDGILIAATFLTSVPLGIATSLAVMSHEVPQALGGLCHPPAQRLLAAACADLEQPRERHHARGSVGGLGMPAVSACGGAVCNGAGRRGLCLCSNGGPRAQSASLRPLETTRRSTGLDRRGHGDDRPVPIGQPCVLTEQGRGQTLTAIEPLEPFDQSDTLKPI